MGVIEDQKLTLYELMLSHKKDVAVMEAQHLAERKALELSYLQDAKALVNSLTALGVPKADIPGPVFIDLSAIPDKKPIP
jgi:hypothetical protein